MEAGELRHQISHQQGTSVRSGLDTVTTFNTVATIWGSIKKLSGREVERAKQIHSEAEFQFRFRYFSTLNVKDRLVFNERTFEVLDIDNIEERNIELLVLAKEVK